jgi:hypothetical protein
VAGFVLVEGSGDGPPRRWGLGDPAEETAVARVVLTDSEINNCPDDGEWGVHLPALVSLSFQKLARGQHGRLNPFVAVQRRALSGGRHRGQLFSRTIPQFGRRRNLRPVKRPGFIIFSKISTTHWAATTGVSS